MSFIEKTVVGGLTIVGLLALGFTVYAWVQFGHAIAQVPEETTCQYPTRPLVDGQCDNSDPADPTKIKGEPAISDSPKRTRQAEVIVPTQKCVDN